MVSLMAWQKWKSEAARSGLTGEWERTVHLHFVTASCIFTLVWVCAVMFQEDFINILWSQTHLKLTCKVFRVWMYTSELMVWSYDTLPTKITPSAYNKHVHDTAEGVALNYFFQAEVGWCHSTDSPFVWGSKWWIHVSSSVMIHDKNLSQSAL